MILIKRSKILLVGLLPITSIVVGNIISDDTRKFDQAAMSSYANSADFEYMNYRIQTASIWDMLKWWLQDLWYEFWSNPISSRLTLYLFILVMLGIAVFYLVKIKYGRVLSKSGQATRNEMIVPEDLHEVDYKSLVSASLLANDFKLAIRYLYLGSLAHLAKKDIVVLREWKTPYDYSTEIPTDIEPHYSQLSKLFEYAWYGDFGVNRADFDKCRNLTERIQEGV